MKRESIVESIDSIKKSLEKIKQKEFELLEKLYYSDDRYLREKLYELEYKENKLNNEIREYEYKLKNELKVNS